MPRETKEEMKINPTYYEKIECEECGGVEFLKMHLYEKDIACVDCANKKLAEVANEIEDEKQEYEALTLEQRNA